MLTIIQGSHVHVVLEFPHEASVLDEPEIHGVFAKRETAEAKAAKLKSRHKKQGHIAVLKQRILGPDLQVRSNK